MVHAEHSSELAWHDPDTNKDQVLVGGEPVGFIIQSTIQLTKTGFALLWLRISVGAELPCLLRLHSPMSWRRRDRIGTVVTHLRDRVDLFQITPHSSCSCSVGAIRHSTDAARRSGQRELVPKSGRGRAWGRESRSSSNWI
jgi:hypothetical protein